VAKLLGFGAGKGGDAILSQQLPAGAADGGWGHQEAGWQLQVAVVLHHAHKFDLHPNRYQTMIDPYRFDISSFAEPLQETFGHTHCAPTHRNICKAEMTPENCAMLRTKT
jgi:hypothetical protein